ncbi:hypothetical protein PO909_032240 [Leuciscus waleckii]
MSLKRRFTFERTPLADFEGVKRLWSFKKGGCSKKYLELEPCTGLKSRPDKDTDVFGEDATSIEGHVKVLQDQYRKTPPDTRTDEERMRRTFAWRRKEITGGMTVEDAVNKYPFWKSPSGLVCK